jgi:hypothetical protein
LDVLDADITVSADWVLFAESAGVLSEQALSNNNKGHSFSDLFIVNLVLSI